MKHTPRKAGTLATETERAPALGPLEVLTVKEVAAELKCSEQTVANRFQDLPGVFDVGSGKRQSLRIPRRVLNDWIEERPRGFSMKKRGK